MHRQCSSDGNETHKTRATNFKPVLQTSIQTYKTGILLAPVLELGTGINFGFDTEGIDRRLR